MTRPVSGVWPRRIAITLSYVATVVAGACILLLIPQTRQVEDGRHTVLLKEFGQGVPITQVFESRSDGLHAIEIQLWASDHADVTIEYHLSLSGESTAAVKSTRRIHDLAGFQRARLDFPEIDRSGGTSCVLELRAVVVSGTGSNARPEVALVASRDRPKHPGYLSVGQDERWGMLNFKTEAMGDTLFGRFEHTTLPGLPSALRHSAAAIAAIALYSVLFIPLITLLVDANRVTGPTPTTLAGRRWLGTCVCLLLALVLGNTAWTHRPSHVPSHLMERLHDADIQTSGPLHLFFDLVYEEVNGEAKPAILAHSTTRVAWRLTVPPHAILRTWTALAPSIWSSGGDGVVFRIQVEDNDQHSEIFWRLVDPSHNAKDRRWIPIEVDLWRFAGRSVDLIFLTQPSLPSLLPDSRYDRALWGDPTIGSR